MSRVEKTYTSKDYIDKVEKFPNSTFDESLLIVNDYLGNAQFKKGIMGTEAVNRYFNANADASIIEVGDYYEILFMHNGITEFKAFYEYNTNPDPSYVTSWVYYDFPFNNKKAAGVMVRVIKDKTISDNNGTTVNDPGKCHVNIVIGKDGNLTEDDMKYFDEMKVIIRFFKKVTYASNVYKPTEDYDLANKKYIDDIINERTISINNEIIDSFDLNRSANLVSYPCYELNMKDANRKTDLGERSFNINYNTEFGSHYELILKNLKDGYTYRRCYEYNPANATVDNFVRLVLENVTINGVVTKVQVLYNRDKQYDDAGDLNEAVGQSSVYLALLRSAVNEENMAYFDDMQLTIRTYNPRFLELDNTTEFIPTGDYHPATKKYADEAAKAVIKENTNKPYGDFVEYISADFEIDANKNIVNSSAFESTAKTDSGSNHNIIARFNIIKPDYFDLFSNTSYKYRAKIYLDGVLLDEVAGVKTGNMSSGSTVAVTFTDPASYPRLQFRWYRDNNYVNGTRVNSPGDLAIQLNYVYTDTVATVWHPAKITVKLEIQAANDLNITSFVTLKEGKQARTICRSDVDESITSIAPNSIGLTGNATDPVPSNSIVLGSGNTYDHANASGVGSCSSLCVIGMNNKVDMLSYAQVIGYNNYFDSYYSGSGMSGVSIIGTNNRFVEPSGDRDSYVTIHGENLNVNNCGAFFGINGTVPHSEIFAVCNGETAEDAPIFSINRDTGAVTAGEPNADNHLATKKYVDDVAANKVDVVEGKALINTGEIARLSKVDNYNDAEVRGLIEDLSNSKADATSIPTKISQLTNDSGFLTAVPAMYATQAYVTDAINKAQLDGSDSEIDLTPYALTSDLALKADKTELHKHENQTLLNSITAEHLTSMAEIADTLNGPKNYYNEETTTHGVYLNSDGRIYNNTSYFTTDYIPIAPGQTLYFYGANGRYDMQTNARFVGFFDTGRNFITGSRVENAKQITNTYENGAYIRITIGYGGWELGYVENVYPGVDIKYGEIPESKLWEKPQKIDVFLPNDIYCAVGTTIELYNNQVCLQADKLHLNWCCDYGHAMKRKFSFEGTSALAGQIIPVTLEIYNDYNVLKYTKTIQIHVVAATITNPITCVPIGDSWTNQKPWPGEVINLSGEKVSFVGKFTATVKDANGNWREYNHEGRSGFSAYNYDGAHAYTFGNAGENTHHAFYNPTTARFDWNNYVNTVLGGTQPGAVILQMGINGISADNTGMVDHEVNMINLIRQDNANIPIFVTLPAYKGNQNGLGVQESSDGHAYHRGVYDYLEKQKVMNYCSLLYEACKDMVGVYFIPLNVCFDSEYNYGAQEVPVNPRATSIIEKIPMEAVHPQDYGYYQMADIVYSVMCGNLS